MYMEVPLSYPTTHLDDDVFLLSMLELQDAVALHSALLIPANHHPPGAHGEHVKQSKRVQHSLMCFLIRQITRLNECQSPQEPRSALKVYLDL